MIKFIKVLMEKGHAYASGSSVYFSIESFDDYGRLSHQDVDQMMHGVRIGADPQKRHPLDFVLWKAAKKGEPSWDSPWGEGRPGWHIECSVMSTGLLGGTFDIHGGGLDLIFPHHENEIAQARAATGADFARYWIHNGLLSVNGEKMSKSLGNYITISDYLTEHRDPDLLKLAFLNSHYRSSLDYTEEKIKEAASARQRIMIFLEKADRIYDSVATGDALPGSDNPVMTDAQDTSESLTQDFRRAMNDDFNTPLALSVIFEAVKRGNEILSDKGFGEKTKAYMANAVKNFILRAAGVLGLSLNSLEIEDSEKDKIEGLVSAREAARKNRDYPEADRLRGQLEEMGIAIEDTPGGTVWRKK
jgi:cysteinyl-tRNA synthetase